MRITFLATILSSMMACGPAHTSASSARSTPPPETAHTGKMCPMTARGTTVALGDVPDGVAIKFTTSGDVAELRHHVHHMAEMHEHMTGMHEHKMANDHEHKADGQALDSGAHSGSPGMMMMVPSSASAEDIDGGAQLVLMPRQADQLEALRQHAHMHAARMAGDMCPMTTATQP
jgi:ABC-type Zn2+ transport system substrate-binding protein/surface adhesin